jgi:hypothetical protein
MRIAFLTEMSFQGCIQADHPNMRTEFAWMHALNAEHRNLHDYSQISGYDRVFIIFPKGQTFLSAEGLKMKSDINSVSEILKQPIIQTLKEKNTKVYYIQEGPHWWYSNYELVDQINFYNLLMECDAIFAHNQSDTHYYKGLLPGKDVRVIPTLMIDHSIKHITPLPSEKVIIGGNFARWYGGFESYIVASEFQLPIWGQTSHATQPGEDQLVTLLPRVMWNEWMQQLSEFKFAVHLMPTVAAGTFSLNCAYLGIPCIGNVAVDTQRLCHPELAVDVADINSAKRLACKLRDNAEFYTECSTAAKQNYNKHYSLELWKSTINLE